MMTPIAEAFDVDRARFESDILPAAKPVVLRGLVRDWPLVKAQDPLTFIRNSATNAPVRAIRAPAEVNGRFHYREDIAGFNFESAELPLPAFLDLLQAEGREAQPRALATQAISVSTHLPGLHRAQSMPLLPGTIEPAIWIGNAAKVATHQDNNENIACVAVGRRRFTLFPPSAIADLYIGPLEHTPAGTPISMVHLTAPDLERYPRFSNAMAVAQTTELEPGDAIFIPYHWWHHVESLDPLSVLVNYWWNTASAVDSHPIEALFHAIMAVRDLPEHQRDAWRVAFEHYVFAPDGAVHLAADRRGIRGQLSPAQARGLRRGLAERLGG